MWSYSKSATQKQVYRGSLSFHTPYNVVSGSTCCAFCFFMRLKQKKSPVIYQKGFSFLWWNMLTYTKRATNIEPLTKVRALSKLAKSFIDVLISLRCIDECLILITWQLVPTYRRRGFKGESSEKVYRYYWSQM